MEIMRDMLLRMVGRHHRYPPLVEPRDELDELLDVMSDQQKLDLIERIRQMDKLAKWREAARDE